MLSKQSILNNQSPIASYEFYKKC